jgi:hypothetical protein
MQETCCSGRSNPLCKLVLPATVFLGAFLDVSEERFDSNGIRRLYDGAESDFGKTSILVPSRAAHPRMIKRRKLCTSCSGDDESRQRETGCAASELAYRTLGASIKGTRL